MSNGVKTANSAKYGPTISLPDGSEFGFTFGIKKARIVLEYLEAVQAFVAKHEPVKPTANHNGNGNGVMRPLPILATAIPRPDPIVWGRDIDPTPLPRVERESPTDEALRAEDYCRGCNAHKAGQGLLVCWGCFKRHPVNPLQSSGLSVEEWIGKFGKFDGKGGVL